MASKSAALVFSSTDERTRLTRLGTDRLAKEVLFLGGGQGRVTIRRAAEAKLVRVVTKLCLELKPPCLSASPISGTDRQATLAASDH